VLTVALSVAAHGLADGVAPPSAAVVLLILLAATIGGLAAGRAHGFVGLLGLLASGQIVGHIVLAAAGHSQGLVDRPTSTMVAAHAAAVVIGGMLIAAGDRLWRALSSVVRTPPVPRSRPHQPGTINSKSSDQPLQWMLLLVASLSHRGPPVGVLR
jgi:hypothetical protein